MSACPFCRRPLLSLASPCCNWCGREIPDAAYQQRAEIKREAFFLEQTLHDAVSLARIECLNVDPWMAPLDPLKGLSFGASYPARLRHPMITPSAQSETGAEQKPQDETPKGRFQHLEL